MPATLAPPLSLRCACLSPQVFIDRDHPLFALLATPGLRERHWVAMEAAVGRELPHSPASTLADMIALGLQNRVPDIADM